MTPRPRRQVEIRRIDDPLHIAARPGRARKGFELRDVFEYARARAIERHRVGWRMRVQVELGVDLALLRQRVLKLVQEPPLELPRLNLELRPRGPVDDADRDA